MKLELYYFESCPYCQIVLECINTLNLEISYCDLYEDVSHREKLFNETGRYTVPCLFIDDKPMHESKDIINWLQTNEEHIPKK